MSVRLMRDFVFVAHCVGELAFVCLFSSANESVLELSIIPVCDVDGASAAVVLWEGGRHSYRGTTYTTSLIGLRLVSKKGLRGSARW